MVKFGQGDARVGPERKKKEKESTKSRLQKFVSYLKKKRECALHHLYFKGGDANYDKKKKKKEANGDSRPGRTELQNIVWA